MSKPISIGIFGAGRIGTLHARNLAHAVDGARVAAIYDVVPASSEKAAAIAHIPTVATTPEQILTDRAVQAVAICSSTDTHADLIIRAAEAGKDIFCEKPIDFDLHRVDQALAAVKKAGVKLQIGFNRRFDPNFRRAQQLVADGKIGTPQLVRITSRDPAPPPIGYIKVSGGIFLDMTIHDFDMARWLVQDELTEIYATGAVLVDPEIGKAGDIDTAVLTFTYRSGAIGTIDNSRQAVYGYDQRIEVFGSKGCVVVANPIQSTSILSTAEAVSSDLPLYFFLERYNDAYIEEMKCFVSCLKNDLVPPVTGIDGRIPVLIGQAARKSLKEKRPVILGNL